MVVNVRSDLHKFAVGMLPNVRLRLFFCQFCEFNQSDFGINELKSNEPTNKPSSKLVSTSRIQIQSKIAYILFPPHHVCLRRNKKKLNTKLSV